MPAEVPLIVIFVVAFGAAVFLAAAETSLLRISNVRAATLAKEEGRRGERLAQLIGRLSRVLNTILLTALLAQIVAATVVGILAERWFGSLGVTLASVVLTIVLFIYAEAIPKTYAVRHADRVGLAVSGPVAVLEWVLRPVVWLLVAIADLQAPGKGITTSPTVTEGELRLLAGRAAAEGEIEASDMELIERAFRFGDRRTDDIMVPRTEVVGVPSDTPVEKAVEIALEAGHRRLVVFEAGLDDVTGIVRLRDLVAIPPDRAGIPVGHLSQEPLVAPETKRIVTLLREMQETGTHLAVIVDEYGGMAGLVTVEDIAEELLGSISEDAVDEDLVQIGEASWSVNGLLPIEDLEATVGIELGEGEWNTVAGLVVGHLGRLPAVGDQVAVSGCTLRVTAIRGHRLVRIEATVPGS
ncbi:MAG: hemolysin family protein [Actinomycetota bacterium]|nr:hemolysin family protein [Actinomycetota bacterium]